MEGPGVIAGRYELRGEIAAGGMASVHLARQIGAAGFSRIVAIKRAHQALARDPAFVGMFLDEARVVARIRHPNVVPTLDVACEGGELFIVMEYVHGESLHRLAHRSAALSSSVPVRVAAAIATAVLHGLDAAHEARSETGEPLGVVHRDVSPQNVLVGVDGVARIVDFGVAKASARLQATQTGQLKGKLSYMAPEQLSGEIDRRADVYATAVVLWETLTGQKLFSGNTDPAVLHQVLSADVTAPSDLNRAVPRALDEVILRGLSRAPEARFATAREMARAIEEAVAIASPEEIGAWVSATCGDTLAARAARIAEIEAGASTSSFREAKHAASASLRASSQPTGAPFGAMPTFSARPNEPPFVAAPPQGSWGPRASMPSSPTTFPPIAYEGTKPSAPPPPRLRALAVLAFATALFAMIPYGAVKMLPMLASGRTPVTAGPAPIAMSVITAPAEACPEGMISIPGGRFFMGSDEDLQAERPAHNVQLRAYCIDRREVTVDAYRACSDRGACKRAPSTNKWDGMTERDARLHDPLCNAGDATRGDGARRGDHPINCVDWSMAERFCRAEGKRLPTEAEWEFAARGPDGRKYPWGDEAPSPKLLNACGAECAAWGKTNGSPLEPMYAGADAWPTTAPVGSFPLGASRFGVEDVVGNVWEWTADHYAPYTSADAHDPKGPEKGASRAVRGGAWNGSQSDWVRPTFRFHQPEATRSHGIGFRCAADPSR